MKKIFATIIALAALVGCNTEVVDEVVSTPQYLTTSLEVALDGDTRVFDQDLVWSWESTDEIAAYQDAGDKIVNTLTYRDNGTFGTDDFKYSTTEAADFKFVYPAAALNDDKTLGYVQTGKWTPTLEGTVTSTTVGEVGAQSIKMEHRSAALEIRVFYSDGETSCPIKSATISTDTKGGVSAFLTDIGESTVVFNVASGDYIYDITLVDMQGREFTVTDKTISFVNGKRTILNVQWTPTISFEVSSWWEAPTNYTEGNTIYFKSLICDAANYEVLVDGNTVTVDDNKITDVASGKHSVKIRVPKKAGGYYSVEKEVVVTSIPTLTYSIYSSYNSFSFDNSENKEEYKVNKDNSKDGSSLYCTAKLSDTYIQNNTNPTTVLVYNDATASISLGTIKQLSGLTLGQYNTYVKCTLANGYELTGKASNIHVTGVPHRGTPSKESGWSWYRRRAGDVENVKWNSDYVQLGGDSGYSRIKLDLYAPADFGVKVDVSGYIDARDNGWGITWQTTTFSISVSGEKVAEVGSGKQEHHAMSVSTSGTLTSSNPTVTCLSDYELSGPYTQVTNFDITY